MDIQPPDIEAATDVVRAVSEQSDDMDFERAVALRIEMIRLKKAAEEAVSMLETELLRQVEEQPRRLHGVTYARGDKKTKSSNHELVLDRAWKVALNDSLKPEGNIDWDHLGQAMRDIVASLYLSPSVTPKQKGLDFIGLDAKQVVTEQVRGHVLVVLGDES